MKNRNIIFPNIVTMCHIFCGFLAIVKIIEGDYLDGAWLILIAAFFDTADGRVAKLTSGTSTFGKEFDSLADLISFGVAASMLVYQTDFYQLGFPGILLCFIYLVAGTIRLARFNAQFDGTSQEHYSGLPITFSGLVLATFVIFSYHIWGYIPSTGLLILLVAGLSAVMISNIKYESIGVLSFLESEPLSIKAIVFYVIILILFIFPGKTIFPFSVLFVLYGVFRFIIVYFKREVGNTIKI